jgi:NAD(P)-dependent dehydrogenase (short-subunit alcohol dehydrogenase family)
MSSQLVWLITGTSSGIGRELTIEVLKRGDKVIATGRPTSIDQVRELEAFGADVLELDVAWPIEKIHEAAKQAEAIHGRVDVIVNNAGFLHFGSIEETTPEETYALFNTNLFGAMNVTRAFLPYMRARRSGTIANIASAYSWIGLPFAGLYMSSKWALRGMTLSLHGEVAPLGIRTTCLDFGHFRSKVLQPNQRGNTVSEVEDYREGLAATEAVLRGFDGKQPGDTIKGVKVVADIIRGEGCAVGRPFPMNLALGSDCYAMAKDASEQSLARLEAWKDVTVSTDFPDAVVKVHASV